MTLGSVGSGEHQDIVVVHLLLLVGKAEELLIDGINLLLVVDLHSEHTEAELQCGTT